MIACMSDSNIFKMSSLFYILHTHTCTLMLTLTYVRSISNRNAKVPKLSRLR